MHRIGHVYLLRACPTQKNFPAPYCGRIARLRTNRIEAQMSHHNAGSVVVCGGGIIGVATAFYLSLQGVSPLLVEETGIASAASGTSRLPLQQFHCLSAA